MVRTLAALAIVVSSVVSSCPAGSEEESSSSSDPLLAAVQAYEREQAATVVELVVEAPPPAEVILAPVPVDLFAATRYALRLYQYDAHATLRAVMGERRYAHLAPKLDGESGWNCGVNNRTSSAAGLGQTLKTQGRIEYLRAHPFGPFTWEEVRGPSCLADAFLIDRLYELCGLGDWTPPYRCLRPLPR